MKKLLSGAIVSAATGALLFFAAPLANARDGVSWSVNIGVPVSGYSVYEQPGYSSPAPVYYRPQPVYVRPAPVYYPSYQTYAVPASPYGAVRYDYHHRRGHGGDHNYRGHRGHDDHRGHHWRNR